MRRKSASPDAETRSYCPPPPLAMSETMSLDVAAYFAFTWQPVAFSKGFTHCGWAYPSQAMRFSCPSPLPILVKTGKLWVGGTRPCDPDPDGELEPHAAATTDNAANTVDSTPNLRVPLVSSSSLLLVGHGNPV